MYLRPVTFRLDRRPGFARVHAERALPPSATGPRTAGQEFASNGGFEDPLAAMRLAALNASGPPRSAGAITKVVSTPVAASR